MSASTVSITANPGARRKPVVTGGPTTNVEQVANGGDLATVNEKVTVVHRKDLSPHSRDPIQLKKAISNGSVPPRRSRKVMSTTKSERKPYWLTIASVFTKNFLLLMVLIGFISMVRRLVLSTGDSNSSTGYLETEGRIAEVESFLKNTAKMIQVQVEVLDSKIEKEVGGLKKEMKDIIDSKDTVYESQLQKLMDKSQVLENYVEELKTANWLSKDEFNTFYVEMMKREKSKGYENGNEEINLDDIRAYAKELVQKEIEKHAADGLGMVDYALASGGGMVVKHSEAYMSRKVTNWLSMGTRPGVHPGADKVLKPSFGEPGQCFPLKGNVGFIQVRLRTEIVAQAVTLEHVAKSVAYDRSSAPKDCLVSGWLQGRDADSSVDTEKMFLLAEFTYDLEKSNAQTFNVLDSAASGIIDTVRLDFTSNHGNPDLTCVYRLRVHGYEPSSVSVTTALQY